MNLIVDANSLITRAYYALPAQNNHAVFGFVNMMLNTITRHNPRTMHFCFDAPDTWRKQMYPDYKKHRKPKPLDLAPQIHTALTTMVSLGFAVYQCPNAEADDVVATLCWMLPPLKVILSSDKDLYQLLASDVHYLRVTKHFQYTGLLTYRSFVESYGFKPEQYVDYMALVGDRQGDNIPGAKGIGPVAATKLIQTYNTISNMFTLLENPDLKLVAHNKDDIQLSLKLVALKKIVGLQPNSGAYTKEMFHEMAAKITS